MSEDRFGPAYRVESQRLVIRCWEPMDAPLLKQAVDESLEHLRPWMDWALNEPTDLRTKVGRLRQFRGQFDLDQDYVYAIFNADESAVLGGTGLHKRLGLSAREIGYWIRKDYVNQGLATEVSAALTKVAFEIDKVDRVEIHCDPKNVRSAAVPRKLGFRHEATLGRRLLTAQGGRRDSMIWTLFAHEYPGSPASKAEIRAYDAVARRIL